MGRGPLNVHWKARQQVLESCESSRGELIVRAVDRLSPLDLAEIELGTRVSYRNGQVFLDGRPSDRRRMVLRANEKRATQRRPPIPYPGV